MSIFDDIAGALSNIFGGGAQQSSSSNSNTSSGSGSQRSDYGDNDSLIANQSTTAKKSGGKGAVKTQSQTITQQPQQVNSTSAANYNAPQQVQQPEQQQVMLPSIEPTVSNLKQQSKRTDMQRAKETKQTQKQDIDSVSDTTKYQDQIQGLPNPLEAIGSWINPEAAETETMTPGIGDNREGLNAIYDVFFPTANKQQDSGQQGSQDNSEQRSDYGDNDSLAVQTQNNAGENKEETDENGHTIYKQGNKFGRGVADAYSAATTGDSRVSIDDAIVDDAYKMTGDERYNRNSDKYYKKHVGEKGYEDIDPYDIDGYMDFGEFISGVNEDGTPITRKQTRQYLMQHPNLGAYVLSSSLLDDAIKSGQLDKAAYKNFVVDYVNDMYDNPRSIEDMQNAYVGAQQDGTTSDFYSQWAAGNSFTDGATDFGNYLEKLYTDSLMKNGANTDYKWYNDWANDLLKDGIYSDGNLDSNPAATTDTYTYQNAANDYNAATAADSTLSDEQKSNAQANYNAASDKLAAQLALMGQLVTAGQNPGSLNLDSIENSVIKNYNRAFNYGDMDKLTDLGTSNGYYASDKYTPEALDASGYAPLGASIAAENPDTNNAFGIAAGGALTAMNPSMGLASVIGNIANKLASEEAKKTTQAIDNAEDQGSALYDQYRSQTGTDAKGNEYPAFSRAYDSGVSVDTPSGVKDFYKRMGANGLSVYNTNNSGALSKDSVQKYMTDTYNANANNTNLPTDDLNLAGKYMKDPTSLTDEEQKQLIGIIGAYADKANHDINPIITSLMARAYAAPTDSPSSLVYTFTPDNLKTALSTSEDKNQG